MSLIKELWFQFFDRTYALQESMNPRCEAWALDKCGGCCQSIIRAAGILHHFVYPFEMEYLYRKDKIKNEELKNQVWSQLNFIDKSPSGHETDLEHLEFFIDQKFKRSPCFCSENLTQKLTLCSMYPAMLMFQRGSEVGRLYFVLGARLTCNDVYHLQAMKPVMDYTAECGRVLMNEIPGLIHDFILAQSRSLEICAPTLFLGVSQWNALFKGLAKREDGFDDLHHLGPALRDIIYGEMSDQKWAAK